MAFAVDVFVQRIIGWRVARSMQTDLVLDAQQPIGNIPPAELEMAYYRRQAESAMAA